METVDTLISARWVIPVEPDEQLLEHHALAIRDGRIVALLPTADATTRYRASEHHELRHHVVLPGLINAHTHAAMTLMRGLADDLPLMEWLNGHIWPAEARFVNEDYVRDGTALAIAEMLRGGVTCFSDMYFFPNIVADVVRESGIRAVIGLIAIDFPSSWASDAQEYLDKGVALHQQWQNETRIHCAFAPHAPYTVNGDNLKKILALAEKLDISIHTHVHETAAEVEQWQQQYNCRPLQHLDELGLLSNRLATAHMTQLNDDEIARVAETGVNVLHCPESNMKLASGFCPVAKLLDAGVNVAIGTDGAASNNDLDMFAEMRSAALLAKVVAGDAAALPAHQALRMATLNGARAYGLEQKTGSLEVGKQADVIALDLDSVETEPLYHPISQLVYATGRQQVSEVWVAGRHLLHNRELLTLDTQALIAKARQWQRQIAEQDGN